MELESYPFIGMKQSLSTFMLKENIIKGLKLSALVQLVIPQMSQIYTKLELY